MEPVSYPWEYSAVAINMRGDFGPPLMDGVWKVFEVPRESYRSSLSRVLKAVRMLYEFSQKKTHKPLEELHFFFYRYQSPIATTGNYAYVFPCTRNLNELFFTLCYDSHEPQLTHRLYLKTCAAQKKAAGRVLAYV